MNAPAAGPEQGGDAAGSPGEVAGRVVSITPRGIVRALVACSSLALLAHLATLAALYLLGRPFGKMLAVFHLDVEDNLPTLFSVGLLFLCSVELVVVAVAERRRRSRFWMHWAALALVFLFLALDESLSIHEQLIDPLRDALDTGGLLYFAWVLPYGAAIGVLGIASVPFLRSLPRRLRWLFLGSGALYVTGAIVLEALGGSIFEAYGPDDPIYLVVMTIEETLEIAGTVAFAGALASYMSSGIGPLHVAISSSPVVIERASGSSAGPPPQAYSARSDPVAWLAASTAITAAALFMTLTLRLSRACPADIVHAEELEAAGAPREKVPWRTLTTDQARVLSRSRAGWEELPAAEQHGRVDLARRWLGLTPAERGRATAGWSADGRSRRP